MEEEIFKIKSDFDRANALFERAKDRFRLIKNYPKEKTYKIIEEYYESIKEAIVSLMYIDGYKALSHIKLIEYLGRNYKELSENQLKLIDKLRKLRNGTLYYGEEVSKEFLINNEKEIKEIFNKLSEILSGRQNYARRLEY